MNQPLSRDDGFYTTKDKKIAIILIAAGLTIRRIERHGGKKHLFFEKERAKPYLHLWSSGSPIPVSDIRQIFNAEEIWNSAIHDSIE